MGTVEEIKMNLLGFFTIISLVVVQSTEGTQTRTRTRHQTLSCAIVASKDQYLPSPVPPYFVHKKAQNVVTCTGCKVVISTLDAILNHQDQLFPKKVMARLTNAGKSSKQILQRLNVEHELNSITQLTDPENESVIANVLG